MRALPLSDFTAADMQFPGRADAGATTARTAHGDGHYFYGGHSYHHLLFWRSYGYGVGPAPTPSRRLRTPPAAAAAVGGHQLPAQLPPDHVLQPGHRRRGRRGQAEAQRLRPRVGAHELQRAADRRPAAGAADRSADRVRRIRAESEGEARLAYTFFGIQVAVKAFFKDDFRARLHETVARGDAEQSLVEKRTFWKRVTAVLNEAMPVFEYGYWDLIRSDDAEEEFESWCSEIEGSVATEPEEMGTAADEVNRLSADQSLRAGHPGLPARAGLEQRPHRWASAAICPRRTGSPGQTFAHLIATVPMLNFANVQADAVYLVPGQRHRRPVGRRPARRGLRVPQAPDVTFTCRGLDLPARPGGYSSRCIDAPSSCRG